jgi:hypothetical protein
VDFQTGVIIGLSGIAVTIMVDQQLRIGALRREMLNRTDLAIRQVQTTVQQTIPLLQSNEDVRRFVSQVCENWLKIDQKRSPFLHQILTDRVRELLADTPTT